MMHPSVSAAFLLVLFACQTPPASDSTSAAQPATQPAADAQPQAQPAEAPAADPAAAQAPAAEPAAQAPSASAAPGTPRNLRVEYRVEPLGIDARAPRFSYELDDARRGAQQSARQILVASDAAGLENGKGVVWDSGKVESRDTCLIAYAGTDLQSWTHYWWKVRSWNEKGEETPWSAPAHWSMGGLVAADFKALWIGDRQPVAEFATGSRGWSCQFADKQDTYKWLKIDLGKEVIWDSVRFYPAAAEDGSDKPWALFPVRINVWGADDPEFGSVSKVFKVIDQGAFDIPLPEEAPLVLPTNSRLKMQYALIGIEQLAKDDKRGFGAAFAEIEFCHGEQVVSTGRPMWSSDSREENGWALTAVNDGLKTSNGRLGDDPLPQPLLRREFDVKAPLTRATLSCTALGLLEVHLNGKRVTQDVHAPGWSDYRKRVVYDTYDVTGLLAQGKNAIGVQLADGWFAGRVGLAQIFIGGPLRGIYGRKPAMMAQLDLEYADGRREYVFTDEQWKSTLAGPLVSADLIDGQSWDARRELPGWDKPGFDDKGWTPVEPVRVPAPLLARCGTPVRIVAEIPPVDVKPLGPDRWLYDFGRNVAGWCKLSASAPAGCELVLRHGEALQTDGSLYTANLRSAKQTDRYVFKGGGPESYEPRFTSHGFRYVEASFHGSGTGGGVLQAPTLKAQVVSNSAEVVGRFHSQHPVLTKLWENISTTLRANIQSVPSDCPQRDERMGWMGDIQVFAPTAMYHSDLAAFFTQWLVPVLDGVSPTTRRFSDISPNPFDTESDFVGAPGWADAGVFLPYQLWQVYGDTRPMQTMLTSATRWLDFVDSRNPDGLWKNERGNDYGDWLNGGQINAPGWDAQGCELDKELFATAFFARSAELTGRMAAVLNLPDLADRYLKLSDKVRDAFQKAYIQPDGTIKGDTQAGYALALAFDLVPKDLERLVQSKLSVAITEKRGWHLTTGMQTTQHLLLELARRGYEEVASRLVRSKDFPSWGWQIEQGATSIWERWDGVYPGRGFQDPSMNSFNHYAFGAVGEYLMSCVAGIEPDPDQPGYAHFFVNPRAGVQIPAAGASYHSIRGTIVSDWRIEGDQFVLDVTIPPNTSATVVIPALGVESVQEGGKSVLEAAPHVLPLDYKPAGKPGADIAGRASFDVRAGKYHFTSQFRSGTQR